MSRFSRRRSFYAAGGRTDGDESAWVPRVDKNPFYRTMDIFNGVFKKNIKLSAGKYNATDGHTIFIDFGELKPSRIDVVVRPGKDSQHAVYKLECGHEWEGRTTDKDGNAKVPGKDWGMCGVCGADQIYRGFEHEWQHIIFKSDLAARRIFCEQYAEQLHRQAPHVDKQQLITFLALLTNAFDDLRVNSLWEKIYPGSAQEIWERWRFYTHRMGDEVNKSFIPFVFAVAFNMPTDPHGELEPLRPVVEWAVKKVKYKGFANMLVDIRVLLDRCMGALLAKMPPPPAPKTMQPPPAPSMAIPEPQNQGDDSGQKEEQDDEGTTQRSSKEGAQDQSQPPRGGSQGQADGEGDSDSDSETEGSEDEDQGPDGQQAGASSGQSQAGSPAVGPQSPGAGSSGEDEESTEEQVELGGAPSATDVAADDQERSNALQRLMQGANSLDPKEEHKEPTQEDYDQAAASQIMRLRMAKVMAQDIQDLSHIEQVLPTGEVDPDMQAQLDQLSTGIASKSESSLLTSNAKARVTIIDVTREGTPIGAPVELDDEERFFINRMRSAFFRTLGRQKAKRSSSGNQVDVQALIQYRGDHQDPNVFENDDVNQGFAYSVLCDMSGSMQSTFPIVCKAIEMLKEALHFPFVVGNLWGFRGGQYVPGMNSSSNNADVWMYRYARDVNWYRGTMPYKTEHQTVRVPVDVGGITPMNSAINVASAHLWRKMPSGMAKRMFLLTDGSPLQVKVSGSQIPDFLLRQFVAKEIKDARKHGIQVYTIVIGDHSIPEEQCLQMFGPRKFWRRVGQGQVGSVLANLVLSNFNRYIKTRG